MPDDDIITDVGEETSKSDEMETITINNQTVTVPKTVAPVIKDMEHNLKSGYDKNYTKKLEEVTAREAMTKTTLQEDLSWYSSHPKEEWGDYESRVLGGRGYIGTGQKKEVVEQKQTVESQRNTSFNDSAKVSKLEKELEEIKQKMTSKEEADFKRGEIAVVEARDTLMRKYQNADLDGVNDALRNYYLTKGEHPSKFEVEGIIKKRHDAVSKIIETRKEPPKTTMPPIKESSPFKKVEKLPRIDDIEGMVKLIQE